ncbi:HCP-like protein [Aureobasidium pullulans]|uniref:HCP-like protein n=1 Tax=Aureobasidium pullulans TaxID=5580 RepID=A0A4S9DAV4_AURPU|nr:HCP-like protein [Aureobasidium pullulans]
MAEVHRNQTPSSHRSFDGAQDQRRASFSPRKSSMAQPTIRMQEAPSSPGHSTSPRQGVSRSSSAQVDRYSSAHSRSPSQHSSIRHLDSKTGLSLHDDPTAGAEEDIEPLPMLQYHHKGPDESPVKKNNPNRISQATVISIGSSSSGGGGLRPPRTSGPRVASQYSLGADLRASTYSPMSADDNLSVSGSPRVYARNQAGNRRSPDTRPMSYIDLLNDLPYSQQVAPAPMMNNISLQSAVGNNASLLDNKKTLDMYRANVKKTNDPSIQYEFAIFMINAARDHAEDTESAAELIKEARGILQRLSDRAYPFAQYYLADGYFSGLFNKDKPDYDKALPLFVAASKHGHAESGYRAALCYEFGWGCTKNYPKAVQFFRAAASKGHPGAAIRLGKACLTGDMGLVNRYREGVKWLKRATDSADYQYNSGPYELGLLHITGFGEDIFKDEAYAAQLMTKSAELGHAEANYRMGQAYENGTFGCPKDAALSVHFYNGAASKGLPEAMMALCAWYMVGAEPVLEKDEVEAYEWSKRAAELGLAKAEYAVGYFTEMGIGCRRDPLEANVWYVKAADKGNETAKQRLDIIRAAASGDSGIPMAKGKAKTKELGGSKEKECIVM